MVYKVAKFARDEGKEFDTIGKARKELKKLGSNYKIFKYQKHLKTSRSDKHYGQNEMYYSWETFETFADLK